MLTKDDPHHYDPVEDVGRWLGEIITPDMRVLEIGPGTRPFPRADVYVDFADVKGVDSDRLVKVDVASEPLPFRDKCFDYVICRHTLEDLYNPFLLCAEMSRVAKAGYIETPSPMAELCRGADGDAPRYRGFHHHRYIVWRSGAELHFVAKYPIIEYMKAKEEKLAEVLKPGPELWNTYYPWCQRVLWKHHQCPADFNFHRKSDPSYFGLLERALEESVAATAEHLDRTKSAAA